MLFVQTKKGREKSQKQRAAYTKANTMTLNCRGATTRGQVSARYDSLPQPDSVSLASYVWIDNRGETLLHKMRTVEFVPARADELPWWDCSEDLSGQHLNVDIFMEPVRLFNDPFFTHNHTSHIANTTAGHTSAAHNVNKLVLCQTYNYEKKIAGCRKHHQHILDIYNLKLEKNK